MRSLSVAAVAIALAGAGAGAGEVLPTGTLRATYIGSNPVQAFVDAKTGELRGPGAAIARGLAQRLGVKVVITPAQGAAGVIDSVRSGEADIGFVACDPARAVAVDFSQPYSLAQNTYVVPSNSQIRSVGEIDKPGMRIGIAEGAAGDLFLARNLKHAEILRNPGDIAAGLKLMADGEISAYAANRQRLSAIAARTIGLRLLPDNFYNVEQAVAVRKGNKALLEVVDKFLEEARDSGLIAGAIARAGLVGVDVAPETARQTAAGSCCEGR